MSVRNKQRWTSHAQLHKPMGAIPSHRNPHLFMDAGKHLELFTGGSQSFPLGFSRTLTSVELVWMQKGLNEMKNQCHEPSSTILFHLASSGLHLGRDLLDNHSAVSKMQSRLVIVAAVWDKVSDGWAPLEKLQSPALLAVESTVAICSTTDNIAVPSCTTTNEWTIWSGRGDDV